MMTEFRNQSLENLFSEANRELEGEDNPPASPSIGPLRRQRKRAKYTSFSPVNRLWKSMPCCKEVTR